MKSLTVLGVETSCDETAAAVVRLDARGATILSNVIATQFDAHAPFGGVVPEIAARAHVEKADRVVLEAVESAGVGWDGLDGVAATAGPGLIGGVMVGLMTGKAIALARDLPFVAVNHLEAHALSARLEADCPYPYLLLLVSGGHCQLLAVEGLGACRRLGSTIDDAVGEAYDKTAKVLGLPFPGGPQVEASARAGDPARFAFPRPLIGRPGCDFSFAGLKTAVLREAQALAPLSDQDIADLCAGFQAAVLDVLRDRVARAMADWPHADKRFVVAGGVAANAVLRAGLSALCAAKDFSFLAPPPALCTDNAAMVALVGAERLRAGLTDGLDAPARPRWPLDAAAAAKAPTHAPGRKGAKA
jgi:N6-L-threonylcarbamoyladenine synthase